MSLTKTSLVFFLFTVSYSLVAQPYLYYPKVFGTEQDERNMDIYRFNLQTGVEELVVHDVGRVLNVFWNNDQSKLFIESRGSLDVIELGNANRRITLIDNIRFSEVLDVFDAVSTNRLYISLGGHDGAYDQTKVFNRSTYDTLTTLEEFRSFHKPFLSADEQRFYRFIPDSTGIIFDIYESNSGTRIVQRKRCGNFGPFAYLAGFESGQKGIGIVEIRFSRKDNFQSLNYTVCNPEMGTISAIIPFPLRSKAHLSVDAKYVIIEEVQFVKDNDPNTPAEYRPGNVYLFESITGKLVQHLTLPPEGQILIFDNYPDKFYYYVPNEQRSININLAQLMTISTISPLVVPAGNSGFVLSVYGANFVSGSTINWNGSPRATTFISSTQLQATILAADVATAGTAVVSVTTTDNRTSNSLSFIIRSTYTLAVNILGSGTVTRIPNQASYDSSSTVQLTATSATGFRFATWSGDTTSSVNPIAIVMNKNKAITARFVAQ